MKTKFNQKKTISRRQVLPFIGFSMLVPFFGFLNLKEKRNTTTKDSFQTLLKPNGTVVQVKESALKKATILRKNISNTSFLKWLTQ